jgi:exosortase
MTSRTRLIEFLVLVFGSLVVWWRPILADFRLALSSGAHTHILLILPLSIALIYFEKKSTSLPSTLDSSGWLGAILLVAALLFRCATAWNFWDLSAGNNLSLNMFSLVIWWIGTVIHCLGLGVFRSFLFPFCFLLLIVPFPEQMLDWVTESLQYQSAFASSILFRLAGVPVVRDGVMLSIPGLDIEVARECSSIRSSMMLLVSTLMLAHLFLRSPWRKVLLVVLAIPLSVVKNAVRIFTIAQLGTRVDPSFLDGRLHHHGGILFLGFALIVIVGLLWALRKGEMRKPGPHSVAV